MCWVRLQHGDESGGHAGGLLPLSATLASSAVFDAFQGESKLDALLHGHSYSGHAAGASAGVAALQIFSQPSLNPAMQPGGGRLKQLWPTDLVHQLSCSPRVESVIALGELHSQSPSPVQVPLLHSPQCQQQKRMLLCLQVLCWLQRLKVKMAAAMLPVLLQEWCSSFREGVCLQDPLEVLCISWSRPPLNRSKQQPFCKHCWMFCAWSREAFVSQHKLPV